jgi:hypothetical protein
MQTNKQIDKQSSEIIEIIKTLYKMEGVSRVRLCLNKINKQIKQTNNKQTKLTNKQIGNKD